MNNIFYNIDNNVFVKMYLINIYHCFLNEYYFILFLFYFILIFRVIIINIISNYKFIKRKINNLI